MRGKRLNIVYGAIVFMSSYKCAFMVVHSQRTTFCFRRRFAALRSSANAIVFGLPKLQEPRGRQGGQESGGVYAATNHKN